MYEREAACDRSFPTRKLFGTDTEMAGTGFGCSGDGTPLVATFPAASQSIFFFLKYSLASANQHAVSVAIETVARLNGVVVS
jgi:hypothetical protein